MSNQGRPGGGGGWQWPRGGPPRQEQQPRTVSQLWPSYLSGGYFDAEGNLKPELVGREKMEPLARAMTGLTSNQLRRYFGHCRAIETRLMSEASLTWNAVLPEIKKLDIAAADGIAKRPEKIPPLFHDFIRLNVAAAKTQRDFLKGFLPHFEALVGFGTAYFRGERN